MPASIQRAPLRSVPRTVPPLWADGPVLLDALPIAAAIIEKQRGVIGIAAWNDRFAEAVALSSAGSMAVLSERCARREGIIANYLAEWFADDEGSRTDFEFRDGNGISARFYRVKMAPLPSHGACRRALLSVVDRTAEVQAERTLRAEMLRDSLTGLPNRVAFTEQLEAAQRDAEPSRAGHAVLIVDMRRFSRINESMGSLAGDELLITFARRLISALRAGDSLARTGGNEFGVIVALRRGKSDALKAATRIQEAMNAPFRLSELEIKVECAIGLAVMQPGQDAEDLFRNAQFAVKQAKASGRPEVYEPKEASLARRRFSIETELRRAIDRDALELHYQPLIDLKSGMVSSFEALARWSHPERGEISPTEFIPVAEESGLILALGRWAMEQAVATLASWDRQAGGSLPVSMGVNLSAIQVARDDVASLVSSALRSYDLQGSRLTIELTESAIVQDPRRATRVFDALKALETTVAMDDFGTGYSSLAYLQRLPIDVLKIDRSFVTGMMIDPDSVAIVRAVLSLAEALGMTTTAEGVESRELATTLAALGCRSGQGFFFAPPLSAEEALAFWRDRNGTSAAAA
jgi:diguanylate cyclase (GGDEF)-like protein